MAFETIFLSAAAWVADKYGSQIAGSAKEVAWKAWDKQRWQKAAAYRDALRRDHATIRILGKPDPVPLEGIFTDVYLLNKPTALRRYDIDNLRQEFATNRQRSDPFGRHKQKRQPGLNVVLAQQHQRLFIMGKPGAGKTTYLRYITLQALDGHIDSVPIFITLKRWSEAGLTLLDHIVREFEICQFPEPQPFIEYILSEGKALVLLDGLDEVNYEGGLHQKAVTEIEDFSRRYDKVHILLTCRIAASDHAFHRFQDVEVADFTQPQIEAFAAKWFSQDETKHQAFRTDFFKQENERLRELASAPILLALLCLAFEDTGKLAQQRATLYGDSINALLRRWDASRSIERDKIYAQLTPENKQRLLAYIAYMAFERGEFFFQQRWLEQQIKTYWRELSNTIEVDSWTVLKAIEAQHGILVEQAHGIYSFAHLTFQEYFAARYIVDNEAGGAVKRLLNQHLTDNRWREVILLTAAMLDNADAFFGQFQQAATHLLAGDVGLVHLSHWADQKTLDAPPPPANAVQLRIFYISRAFARGRGRARVSPSTSPATLTENAASPAFSVKTQVLITC